MSDHAEYKSKFEIGQAVKMNTTGNQPLDNLIVRGVRFTEDKVFYDLECSFEGVRSLLRDVDSALIEKYHDVDVTETEHSQGAVHATQSPEA